MKNQICANKQAIVDAETHTENFFFYSVKKTNLKLSTIAFGDKEKGEKLENLSKKFLGTKNEGKTLNQVCFDLDKKYDKKYLCTGADNNNINGHSGCCYAIVTKTC